MRIGRTIYLQLSKILQRPQSFNVIFHITKCLTQIPKLDRSYGAPFQVATPPAPTLKRLTSPPESTMYMYTYLSRLSVQELVMKRDS